MDIQAISPSAFALLLTGEDLRRRHITPDTLTAETAAALLRAALGCGGLDAGAHLQIELFPGRDQILLFARYATEAPVFFAFDSLEDLLSAVAACRDTAPASLFSLDGMYILALRPWCGDAPPLPLFEFGRQLDCPARYALFLEEHAVPLAHSNALEVLKAAFSLR